MALDFAKKVLVIAQTTQGEADNIYRPPVEITPSRSEGVIPSALFKNTRGYLEKIVYQINKSYEHTCYDGCAVMIRRLIETLIIESFIHHKLEAKIKDIHGNFFHLQDLINIILQEHSFNLSRNIKKALPDIKDVGDKSAHSRHYNACRLDIDKIQSDIRFISEQLLYLSGIKK